MLNIGPQELLVILVIALLVVGPQRLPELGRSIGRGLRELRKAQDEVKRTISVNLDDEPPNGSSRRPASESTVSDPASAADPTPPAVAADTPPTAPQPLPANEVREISRSLGRSLSELRRAKEEVRRSFRVDLTGPTKRPTPPVPPTPRREPPRPSTTPKDPGSGEGPDAASDGPAAG